MKGLLFFSFLMMAGYLMVSCQKEYSCEQCDANKNRLPIARAGADIHIQFSADSALLDGSTSIDPDGHIIKFEWSVISGPSGYRFTDPHSPLTLLKELQPGVYLAQLLVTDNDGATAKDSVQVFVESLPGNILPVAIAGPDQTVLLPTDSALLDGSSSFDQDGLIASYQWQFLDGPSIATIKEATHAQTQVTGLKEGTYHFQLIITDNKGLLAQDTVQVRVLQQTSASGGFTFNLFWTCKDRCDDTDVFVSILEGFNLFADPNIPMEVSVMENNTWIPANPYKLPLPTGTKYYYLVSQRTLFVYRAPIVGAKSYIGTPVVVKVKFI